MAKKQVRDDIVARADDAYGSSNYAEYVVEKKVEGKYKMQRRLMLLAYLGIAVAILAVVAVVNNLTKMGILAIPMFALSPMAALVVYRLTWPAVSIEYSFTVDASMLTVEKVLGGRKKIKLFEAKVKDLSLIAPYDDEYRSEADGFAADNRVEAVPAMDCYDLYFALHTDDAGKKTIVFFQATAQSLKALKYYNSSAIVMRETSR
ncbi:MAG: hypothetical protein IJX76_01995 [Clostridia bacterium]|nr:hypothetical protein [Clostridia bacterium]